MSGLLLVVLAFGALFVRLGQAIGAMGMARAKNVASAGFRSMADMCVVTLCFWALGAAILFQQNNAIFAIRADQLVGRGELSSNWFVMLSAILIASGIVAPALAERSRLIVPLAIGALLGAVLVPLIIHWSSRGWLSQINFVDAAGAGSIHLAPAICAMVAAIFVGARDGKYNRDRSSNMIPGHSLLMTFISVALMLIGWIPYVLAMDQDSDATRAAANVMISAAAAGLTSLIISHSRYGKADILLTCTGLMGGMVAITASGGHISTFSAFACGVVAGVIVPAMAVIIDLRFKIDDPACVIAIHGAGGIWALIAAALFQPAAMGERVKILGAQLLGIVVIILVSAALCTLLLLAMRSVTSLRSKDVDEYDGLDLAEHDINAHPDFQQTMIKSYHLREA